MSQILKVLDSVKALHDAGFVDEATTRMAHEIAGTESPFDVIDRILGEYKPGDVRTRWKAVFKVMQELESAGYVIVRESALRD
jgi:hypothetical protein